jgi:hypothetical protein
MHTVQVTHQIQQVQYNQLPSVEGHPNVHVLFALYVYMLRMSLTTNDYFPESFNWLFFVIVLDFVLCEKGSQFVAYFLSLCVKKVNS